MVNIAEVKTLDQPSPKGLMKGWAFLFLIIAFFVLIGCPAVFAVGGLCTIGGNCSTAQVIEPNYKAPPKNKAIPVVQANSALASSLSKSRSNIVGQGLSVGTTITAPHGGSAENTILIIDPTVPESMYIGNYYKNARNIPDRNVFYMNPTSSDYNTFAAVNLQALFGTLNQQQISDHINYITIAPLAYNSPGYRIPDSGHLSSGCSDANNFSLTAAYTSAFMSSNILSGVDNGGSGGFSVLATNQYSAYAPPYSLNAPIASAFDSALYWFDGQPSASAEPTARLFLGTLLGYVGTYATSVSQITAMIDRSVAVDGTHPSGTFYFMNTSDPDRDVRSIEFSAAVTAITSAGGQAEIVNADLPLGENDVLGVMSGFQSAGIVDANMTILPGAFGDHLTSWAGVLDSDPQESMLDWIQKGASGTDGTVEEPCNYAAKFPDAFLHVFYFEGSSLGESYLRSMMWIPFQDLFSGDPLTRPFGYFPTVNVAIPANPVSGTITIVPTVQNTNPGASGILGADLYVDGIVKQTILDGQSFQLDTTLLSDGFHDIRVVSYDNSAVATPGRWVGQLQVNNYNRGVINLTATPASGDLSTIYSMTINSSSVFSVSQVRLMMNNRVIASASALPATFNIMGSYLGGGPVKLTAVVEYIDGVQALSAPLLLNISYTNSPTATTDSGPTAFSYSKDILTTDPILVELPAINNQNPTLTYSIVQGPSQASLVSFGPGYGTILLKPQSTASGTDTIVFSATSTGGTAQATVTLRYKANNTCIYGCVSGDNVPTLVDAQMTAQAAIGLTPLIPTQQTEAQVDGTGHVNIYDAFLIAEFVNGFIKQYPAQTSQ